MNLTKNKFVLVALVAIGVILSSCTTEQNKEKSHLKWWQDTIVYEIYPNSFQDSDGNGYGDIRGIISRLDYLQKLGVGAIWLTPVYGSPMGDNGYDVSDYYSINPRYGTMADMDELIAEAKKRNIKIVMDLVFNHTSDEHEWFKSSASKDNTGKDDWYIWRDAKADGSAPNNWRGIFGGSAWTWHEGRGQYYLHTFADFQPDLNWENPGVRKALCDIANFWADKGVGGFRLDAIPYIKKPSPMVDGIPDSTDGLSSIHNMTANTAGILDFLHEFKNAVCEGRDIFTVGEANGVSPEDLPRWIGNDGVFDMIFEFGHVNVQFVAGEVWSNTKDWKLSELKHHFFESQKYTATNGWYPIFLENHDQPRSVEHFIPNYTDQVKSAKALAMIMMTLRGTPFMYEGQELGMVNVDWNDINNYNDISSHNQYHTAIANGLSESEAIECVQKYSRDNARTPMQWDDSENAGFTTGTPWLSVNESYKNINAKKQESEKDSVLSWYYQLKKLRDNNIVLRNGDFIPVLAESDEIFAYRRTNESDNLIILVNFTDGIVEYEAELVKGGELLASSHGTSDSGKLKAYEAVCYRLPK